MDISTHHSKPASVRTSNRKKQSPLTRNEDFFMEMSLNEVPNNNIITDAKPKRFQKFGEKLTTDTDHTNKTHFNKLQQTTMKNNNDNLITFQNDVTRFSVLHQNIRGLLNKSEELIISLFPDSPLILCLTEHHLNPYRTNVENRVSS